MTSYDCRTTRSSVFRLFSLVGKEMPIILFFDNTQSMDDLGLEPLLLVICEHNPNIMYICTCLDVQTP